MAKGSRGGKRVTTGGATATLNPTAQAQQQNQQVQGDNTQVAQAM